jgi:two-component system nitrogen regulation sensor histidine kinase NtrY
LKKVVEFRRKRFDLAAVRIFKPDLEELVAVTQSGTHIRHLQAFHLDLVKRSITTGKPFSEMQDAPTGDFVAGVHPILKGKQVIGAVAVFTLLPRNSLARSRAIAKGLEGYRQLKAFKQPIKTNQYVTLSIVTLLIIFAATWFGFHLAKTITVPLQELAVGTQRVAEGDYDFSITTNLGSDEMGALVNSFNRMTADLKTSKARLEEAHKEMQRTSLEMNRRRRYMEIVLSNVAAGVISLDSMGRITTFNQSAARLLKVESELVVGKHWRKLLEGEHLDMAERLLMGLLPGSKASVSKQVRLKLGGEFLTLMVHIGFMQDDAGKDLGMVVVFEDLTELEKAQRMAAWREVARRIAHEVKNPLTPIKLSAQRLVRRYTKVLGEEEAVFKECTRTIIDQVDELQRLVSEFSTFARLPASRLEPGDIVAISEKAISLFRGGRPDITFEMECDDSIPVFDLDKEQMSRVLINLLENAVAAVQEVEPPRQVKVRLTYDDILKIVRLEVEDTGPGVPPKDRIRLFEPYFSTKRGGTGLGLAIVSTIVADHNGYVRVQDNQPRGARIIVELPAGRQRRGILEAL